MQSLISIFECVKSKTFDPQSQTQQFGEWTQCLYAQLLCKQHPFTAQIQKPNSRNSENHSVHFDLDKQADDEEDLHFAVISPWTELCKLLCESNQTTNYYY